MKSIDKGLLKTFSKMGISTLQSYQGAQIFETVGLNQSLVEKYFTGTSSRIEGIGIEVLAREAIMKHEFAMQPPHLSDTELRVGGEYQYPRARRTPPAESDDGQQAAARRAAREIRELPGIRGHRESAEPRPANAARHV